MSFQKKVNLEPVKGWPGDFASTNVRVSFLGDTQEEKVLLIDGDTKGYFTQKNVYYQAGVGGVQAGSFVWVDETTNTVVNTGVGSPAGFVGRELTGVPAQYLQEASMTIPAGFMVTVYEKGEFLVQLPIASVENTDTGTDTGTDINVVERDAPVLVDKTGNIVVKDGIVTKYRYVTSAKAGELVAISAWI